MATEAPADTDETPIYETLDEAVSAVVKENKGNVTVDVFKQALSLYERTLTSQIEKLQAELRDVRNMQGKGTSPAPRSSSSSSSSSSAGTGRTNRKAEYGKDSPELRELVLQALKTAYDAEGGAVKRSVWDTISDEPSETEGYDIIAAKPAVNAVLEVLKEEGEVTTEGQKAGMVYSVA